MATRKEEQILELIKNNASTLICLPEQPSTDAIASGLGLLHVLEALGKRARVVSSGFRLPANHTFLPKSDEIFDDLTALRKFIISVNTKKVSVEELSYTMDDGQLNIYITPKDGIFSADDVKTSADYYAYDLIIVLDAQDLESLGRIYENNTDFFYHTPLINIDHSPANEQFGQVNLMSITATSTSEIIFELIDHWKEFKIDEYTATNLLTGMISKTKSFQSGSVTPRSLSIASHLISQGARREEIVKHLYQSKKISTLKLWGSVLSKLEVDKENKIVWSILTSADFQRSKATIDDLPDVIDELIINTPDARDVFILTSKEQGAVEVIVSTAPYIDARELFREFQPTGSEHFVQFTVHKRTPEDIKSTIIEKLRSQSQ